MSDVKDPNQPSGPVTVGDIEITVDRDACIGASACIPAADKTYTIDDEGKAVVLATADENTEDDIVDGARACPVQAIKVTKGGETLV